MASRSQPRRRRSIRWQGYDYRSSGAYFVTICTHDRSFLLDHPALRQAVETIWEALPERFPFVRLDEFVIMPNHVHFVLWIGHVEEGEKTGLSLGEVVGAFKSLTARAWLQWVQAHIPAQSARLWQRNYHEHVIRDEEELSRIRQYIRDNPSRWGDDPENPDRNIAPES